MALTKHAQNRMQQRGIPPLAVELLMAYGRIEYQNGSQLLYFDNRSFKRVCKKLDAARKNIEQLAKAYLVIGENGQVITTSHRTKQIKRK
ncbi:conserved hypothetical protein [Nitrosococcus halophilus Nc 4]|uniref:DUF4258 domain-containing protein n=1 Tax=Nitrosococcus halophilus (strain Nc4) TaxID=472759 RepID=D5BXK9_NITHN|nr:DUF4258 domain-containing protein [Nitrosococcus halophilus]ADE13967.1 conserved hypothetical protein [Nitrosococcus halophilus Nc 4]